MVVSMVDFYTALFHINDAFYKGDIMRIADSLAEKLLYGPHIVISCNICYNSN